jgi:hypothetical protein
MCRGKPAFALRATVGLQEAVRKIVGRPARSVYDTVVAGGSYRELGYEAVKQTFGRRDMKRAIMISTGAILLMLGAGYSLFWGQAIREAGSLFAGPPTEESVREHSPCFVRAVSILGVDIFATAGGESPEPVNGLAMRISRGMYTHLALGFLALFAGVTILIAGLLKRKSPEQPDRAVTQESVLSASP